MYSSSAYSSSAYSSVGDDLYILSNVAFDIKMIAHLYESRSLDKTGTSWVRPVQEFGHATSTC